MQGAFKLIVKGKDLTKIHKWLEDEKMFEYFSYEYNKNKTQLEMGDSCNLTAMNHTYVEEMFNANPEVEITFDMIYDNGYVVRYHKKKDTTEYTQDDDFCMCTWCGKIIPVSEAEFTGEDMYDEYSEPYCKKCYKEYLEEEGIDSNE